MHGDVSCVAMCHLCHVWQYVICCVMGGDVSWVVICMGGDMSWDGMCSVMCGDVWCGIIYGRQCVMCSVMCGLKLFHCQICYMAYQLITIY